jgi:hypothetical protein
MTDRSSKSSRNQIDHRPTPDTWPVTQSLLLAFVLEVLPLELYVLGEVWIRHGLLVAMIVKAVCLTLILFPLALFCVRNGLVALKRVLGRFTLILAIVSVALAFDYVAARYGIGR